MFNNCLQVFKKLKEDKPFNYSQKKILIIDDESFNCQAMLGMISVLKLPGISERVHLAYSGKEAIELVEKSIDDAKEECDYAVIFTDCSMPFMDGYECCQKIHKIMDENFILDKPKILAVTGHVESEYQRKALRSGMDSLFSKPIKIDQLAMVLLEQGFYLKLPQELETELEEFSR